MMELVGNFAHFVDLTLKLTHESNRQVRHEEECVNGGPSTLTIEISWER